MCLCLFDINYTSNPYIQIISYYSSIIGFQMIASFVPTYLLLLHLLHLVNHTFINVITAVIIWYEKPAL